MELSESLRNAYGKDRLSAHEAQLRARFIAWGPVVFQVTRVMLERGILEMLRNAPNGLLREDIVRNTGMSDYAVKCLLEASLCIGTVLIDADTDTYFLGKTGWFLLSDPSAKVDIDFNHDVNYEGLFHLSDALEKGKPEGLRHFGNWPTIYEGLSSLPPSVQDSWFAFDHFYSDHSFDQALEIVFKKYCSRSLYDVGGNTGRWALQCVAYDSDVRVTVIDLPQQLEMMRKNIQGKRGYERIDAYGMNLLDEDCEFPEGRHVDAVWMSQFLDCFGMDEVKSILRRARKIMDEDSRLYIMETIWNRQQYEPAAFVVTMISLYFTAMANGNSKMFNMEDIKECIEDSGLSIEEIHDGLGYGHTLLVCKIRKNN